jgi:hypothetical protein
MKVRLEHWQPMLVKGEAAFSTVRELTTVRRKEERRTSRMVILLVFLLGSK